MHWCRKKSKKAAAALAASQPAQPAQSAPGPTPSQPTPRLPQFSQPAPQQLQPTEPAPRPATQSPQPPPYKAPSPAVSVPLGLDASQNEEITAIWIQVEDRVRKLAYQQGKHVNPALGINDVLANLNAAQQPDKQDSETSKIIKQSFSRTLGLIKTVGGIITDGASQVFAPAGQCYNVISFVINAFENCESVFEDLAQLLDKCADHLDRLGHYMKGGMDTKLTKVAYQHLQLFVAICERTLKLRDSRWATFKTFMKISFLAENDIQDLLGKMESLVDKEGRLVAAQTFNFASEAAANSKANLTISHQMHSKLDTLIEGRVDQKESLEAEKDKKTLLNSLAFDQNPDNWDNTKQEPRPFWLTTYNNFRKFVVPGTGEWLLSSPTFHSWATQPKTPSILGILGTEASGKSYLTSSVIRYLRQHHFSEHSNARHLVAFYFLNRQKTEDRVDTIAKSLVWQFADNDASYMQSAAHICEKTSVLDPEEILPRLLLDNKTLSRIDARFYIVIDGLKDTVDDGLIRFLRKVSDSQSQAVRVFLTGTPLSFQQLAGKGISSRTIPITSKNADDIKKLIDSRMDKIEALSDSKRVGVAELRRKIQDTLYKKAAGDYFKIDLALNQISTLDYVKDIDRVLEGAGKERSQQIREEIQNLNETRTPRQLEEINEIVLWLTFAAERIRSEQMAAVLYMKSHEAPLRSLEAMFRTKYLLFMIDRDGYVDFKSSKALRVIPLRSQLNATAANNDQAIQPGEIQIVQHFLNTVCPPALYQKLEFEQYLNQKLSPRKDQIQQEDKDTAHLKLALICLRVLTEGGDAMLTVLQGYALRYLVHHLLSVDLALVDREWKSKTGPNLAKLFTDERSIDILMWSNSVGSLASPRARTIWLDEEYNVDEILRWMKDSAVISDIQNQAVRAWVADLASGSLNSTEVLLKPSAMRMAVHCFREPSSQTVTMAAFQFILAFILRIQLKKDYFVAQGTITRPSPEQISQVESWSQAALNITEKDALWEVQMAIIFADTGRRGEAERRCRHALQLDGLNWRASHVLGNTVASNEEAINIMMVLVNRLRKDSSWMEDPTYRKVLAQMTFDLGNRYWAMDKFDAATQTFSQSIQEDPTNYMRTYDIFLLYQSNKRWSNIAELIGLIGSIEKCHLSIMAIRLADQVQFHEILLQTAIKTEKFNVLSDVYKNAIESASGAQEYTAVFFIRLYYALALYQIPNRREDKVIGLWETALKEDLPRSDLDMDTCLHLVVGKLGAAYLHNAREAKSAGDPEVAMEFLGKISDMLPEEVPAWQLLLPPQLFTARYHYLEGDETQARYHVRNTVQVALEILSDDDEGNDLAAYWRFLGAFLPFDDDKNVLTALSMITINHRFQENENKEPEYSMSFDCDGHCGHVWNPPSEMWLCKDCIGVTLDRKCYDKLRNGSFRYNICASQHEFVFIPKWDEERIKNLPRGYVPWGEKNISLGDWQREIKKKYVDIDG
ncbi:hypothetical protein ASPWEDRAFT_156490 [Aspergillus wentii DTO 134E9]|uniref:Uncharacterized protein n=1 Tax=Aspergillus wentii DTO 134E9 TaxID=1073089 RepID=A0A1L9RMD8_ASPWE|nr:uncharacterized protein ASPWEDRAFT_156490 [Aspergillus wentii DTO 134E9]OJJ36091.1 hypothetical protein ASPWEDRAFT_156490 [Aspergillus wentii DTO 134E9]